MFNRFFGFFLNYIPVRGDGYIYYEAFVSGVNILFQLLLHIMNPLGLSERKNSCY